MNRKYKLLTTLTTSFVLLSLLMLGVYSTVTRQVGITGQITFVGVQVEAEVVVRKTNILGIDKLNQTTQTIADTYYNPLEQEVYKFEIGKNQDGKNFALGNIEFTDTQTVFSFKIEIKSNMKGQAQLEVDYQNNIDDFPSALFERYEKLELKNEEGTSNLNSNWETTIGPDETIIWTVIFKVITPGATPNYELSEKINESFTIKRATSS